MSATAEGTAINRELRELERQATETLSLEPVLHAAAASQEPMLGCRWQKHIGVFRLGRTTAGATMKRTAGTVEYARLSHERRSAGSGSLLEKSVGFEIVRTKRIGLCRLAN